MFKAFGNPERIAIIELLKHGNSVPAKTIEKELEIKQSTLTHHMSVLRNAGLIESYQDTGDQRFVYSHLKFGWRPELHDWLEDLISED